MTSGPEFPIQIDQIRKHYDRLSHFYRLFWGERLHHVIGRTKNRWREPRSN